MIESDPMGFEDFCNTYLSSSEDVQPCAPSEVWAMAEDCVLGASEAELRKMLAEIDTLLALPSEQERRTPYGYALQSLDPREGAFDDFIRQYRARVERELAGDLSRPLVQPEGWRGSGAPPLSPQGYDIGLPSAGSFDSPQIADAVVDAVLQAYGDRVQAFFAHSKRGRTRRLPPMRMRFDREVGMVAVRDAGVQPTRLAVVLLHDVGGEPLVCNAFPMEEVPEPPRFEALSILLGSWLHADWVDDYPADASDPVEQVRRFARAEPHETVARAVEELEALQSAGTEDDRRRAVRGLCSYFLPRPPGQLDAFLAEAAQVLREATS